MFKVVIAGRPEKRSGRLVYQRPCCDFQRPKPESIRSLSVAGIYIGTELPRATSPRSQSTGESLLVDPIARRGSGPRKGICNAETVAQVICHWARGV
jgi:hypothetical protein